jgi:hypothetical protein
MPSEAELLTLYKKLPQPASATHPNPLYGELVSNLIFKLGGWPEYMGIGSFVKGLVSSTATESIEEIRASHHYLTTIISQAIHESFAKKEYVFELLYAPTASPSVHTKEKLNHQIDILSRLSYDLIIMNTQNQYQIVQYGVKKYIKNGPSAINDLITDVYKKIFSRHQINESLLMQFFNVLFKNLQETNEMIKQQEQITLHLETNQQMHYDKSYLIDFN